MEKEIFKKTEFNFEEFQKTKNFSKKELEKKIYYFLSHYSFMYIEFWKQHGSMKQISKSLSNSLFNDERLSKKILNSTK